MLSAVVITLNEEQKLKDAIKSLSFADEILVVDSGSTDKTFDIAKKEGARVIVNKRLKGFTEPRNYGLKEAKGDWILYMDADERVTPELKIEIQKIINVKKFEKYGCFAIPRKNIILGKELKHGWWPDYVKRLFFKDNIKGWTGDLHEEPDFVGDIYHLKSPFLHIKHSNLSEMVGKTNKWSEVEAKLMLDKDHPPMNAIRFSTALFREFWLRMISQKAFLDGTVGIIYAIYQIFSRFLSYAKLWEMQLNSSRKSR